MVRLQLREVPKMCFQQVEIEFSCFFSSQRYVVIPGSEASQEGMENPPASESQQEGGHDA